MLTRLGQYGLVSLIILNNRCNQNQISLLYITLYNILYINYFIDSVLLPVTTIYMFGGLVEICRAACGVFVHANVIHVLQRCFQGPAVCLMQTYTIVLLELI